MLSIFKNKQNTFNDLSLKTNSLIILFIFTGGIFLVSTSYLVSIFLAIELQSYGLDTYYCTYL